MANGTIAFDTLTTSDSVKSGTEKSVDTSYIFNGVAKFWASELSHANDTAEDTFNNSSFTNIGTGKIGCNFTNNMSNNDCSVRLVLVVATIHIKAHDYEWQC